MSEEYRYAELPDGKRLRFPKHATDKEIQRAVRKELGITAHDIVLIEQFEALIDKVKGTDAVKIDTENLADAFQANANRISGELSDAIREMNGAIRDMNVNLKKILSSQTDLIIKLQLTVETLNRTMDHALGESFGTIDTSHKIAGSIDGNIKEMQKLVSSLTTAMREMSAIKNVRRRARRERDGSVTFETLT